MGRKSKIKTGINHKMLIQNIPNIRPVTVLRCGGSLVEEKKKNDGRLVLNGREEIERLASSGIYLSLPREEPLRLTINQAGGLALLRWVGLPLLLLWSNDFISSREGAVS